MSISRISPAELRNGDAIGVITDSGAFKTRTVVQELNLSPDSSCNGVHVNEGIRHAPSECYDRCTRIWVARNAVT